MTNLIHLFTEPWLRSEQAPIVAALSTCDHGVDLKTDCRFCNELNNLGKRYGQKAIDQVINDQRTNFGRTKE